MRSAVHEVTLYVGSVPMKLSLAIASAIFLLASLTACIGDRASEAVDEFIEDAKEDALGTPTPQSGGVPAPPARNAPTEASSGAAEPKIEPTGDSGPTVTPQSMANDAEGGPEADGNGTSVSSVSFASVSAGYEPHLRGEGPTGPLPAGGPMLTGSPRRPPGPSLP